MSFFKKYIPFIIIGAIVLIGVTILSLFYGDFLGTRVLRKASSRVVAYQGEQVTIQVADSNATRKLELCVEKKNLLLGYSDFSDCKTLQYVLGPHVKSANITIPSNFPLGRALVVTRVRDAQGNLIPVGPSDEKITLLIQKARPVAASNDTGSSDSGEGGGSSGGGGSGQQEVVSKDNGRNFDLKIYGPGSLGRLLSRKSIAPVDVAYEGDWTAEEKEYACSIAEWKLDGYDISSDQWLETGYAHPPRFVSGVFCSGYLDLKKISPGEHEIRFVTKTPGGRELFTNLALNLADD